jgi:Flp pilus assembly protein TadD
MQYKLMRLLPRALAGALLAGILGCHFQNASFAATRAVAPPPDSAAHWNARANLCLLQAGENIALVDTAKQYYIKAIKLAPEDAGLKLNLAIAHMAIGDTLSADSLFYQAYAQVGNDTKKLCDLLGLEDEVEESRGGRNVTADEVKTPGKM